MKYTYSAPHKTVLIAEDSYSHGLSRLECEVIHFRNNIYIEINYELASVTVWNLIQDQWVIYVKRTTALRR